jgi:hypothetical protein
MPHSREDECSAPRSLRREDYFQAPWLAGVGVGAHGQLSPLEAAVAWAAALNPPVGNSTYYRRSIIERRASPITPWQAGQAAWISLRPFPAKTSPNSIALGVTSSPHSLTRRLLTRDPRCAVAKLPQLTSPRSSPPTADTRPDLHRGCALRKRAPGPVNRRELSPHVHSFPSLHLFRFAFPSSSSSLVSGINSSHVLMARSPWILLGPPGCQRV